MKKRAILAILIFVLFFNNVGTRASHAEVNVDINDPSVFLEQSSGGRCTHTANVMMLRRDAILRGDANWSQITEETTDSTLWIPGTGMHWDYDYGAARVKRESFEGKTAEEKRQRVIELISTHAEGIVLHSFSSATGYPHAVLLTDYTDGTFYCAETASSYSRSRILLSESLVSIEGTDQIWYVSNNVEVTASPVIDPNKVITAKCQMPYYGEGGGYLIGFETKENNDYRYEVLILDCTLLMQGKPAWIYSTGQCGLWEGRTFWTIWQPVYGYYWTLFRVYDNQGNLLDEECYGFQNI